MDREQAPFNVGIGCVVTGTATYNVEHTFDDVQNAAVTPTWFQNTALNGQTGTAQGSYSFPVAALRLNVTAGAGTVTMTVLQSRR
jgi:hypothetical protein